MELLLLRWIHFLAGITWIGLLYYFNFVQGPFFAETDAATKSSATQKLVPRALWWFRWGAMLTFLSGAAILGILKASWSNPWGMTILTGAAFGTVMFLNVWLVIWPNQKVVIASAVAAASGGQANPAAAAAGRRAFLASRTNVVFSFPMLLFMGAASHFALSPARNAGLFGLLLLAVIVLLELNALTGSTGPTKKPLETVRSVIITGFVTALVVYCLAQAVLGSMATA
ncbi:MAG TPA: urate hydroxylase PuuD [Gemmatimonadales bacterium]|nr:urate hydroxylase PuuD [Gemmatimonadales bacterium]